MSKVNDLLTKLDEAFDNYESQAKKLAEIAKSADEAVKAKQAELDAVKADYGAMVSEAQKKTEDARVALDRIRQEVNERIGNVTGVGNDPFVSVR